MTTPVELRRRIADVEAELGRLRGQLAQAEADEKVVSEASQKPTSGFTEQNGLPAWKWPLQADEYERYARQLILPAVGIQGQLRLRNATVLIIGAGGLGCPAATYLAAAGVGHLMLVDGDVVEVSNLHRQIAHTTDRVGQYKVDSLAASLRWLNPRVRCSVHREHLTPSNVSRIFSPLSSSSSSSPLLVLDCTDHPAVRYLVSDACVRAGVPLVSAAALRTDGQLAVLNWPVGRGPCYRCVFPRPPPVASQTSCAEGGVLGPVVGVMGVLQALEALRVLMIGRDEDEAAAEGRKHTLLLFSAGSGAGTLCAPTFRSVRLKGRRADCFACSADAPLQKLRLLEDDVDRGEEAETAWPDYIQFCSGDRVVTQAILEPDERVTVDTFRQLLEESTGTANEATAQPPAHRHWLLDVREKELFDMGSIDGAVNVPFSRVQRIAAQQERTGHSDSDWLPAGIADDAAPVYVVCRVGNDSQVVARQLKDMGLDRGGTRFVGDIAGGMLAWKRGVDNTMPFA